MLHLHTVLLVVLHFEGELAWTLLARPLVHSFVLPVAATNGRGGMTAGAVWASITGTTAPDMSMYPHPAGGEGRERVYSLWLKPLRKRRTRGKIGLDN